jgi:two-component system, response regulator, stage 0 sporulation protein A
MKSEIMTHIKKIGISSKVKGFRYLTDGIEMVIEDRDLLEAITKELYPAIAKKNNTSSTGVEKAIRHAIKNAWRNGYFEKMENHFCSKRFLSTKKPTNGEFIAVIADKFSCERKCLN